MSEIGRMFFGSTGMNVNRMLDALGLPGLTDPYTEKPLSYRPEGEGFVVYGFGDDRKDNGGAPRPEREDSDPRRKLVEYDEVWRFPNPANRKN